MPAALKLQRNRPKLSGWTESTTSAGPPDVPAKANSVPATLSVVATAVGIVRTSDDFSIRSRPIVSRSGSMSASSER